MRIYMDVCCLNRPFDDLSQDRIHLESDAILTILSRCESGKWKLISSEIIDLELQKATNIEKLKKVRVLCSIAQERLILNKQTEERAREFQRRGVKEIDSLHLAIAEEYPVDVFLTTDDDFIRAAKRTRTSISVANPVTWLMEVMQNEQ